MEAFIVLAVIALIAGAVYWRKKSSAGSSAGEPSPVDPFPPVQQKADSGAAKVKLPAASKLKKFTKKQLVAMAEENGVELNDKKTKDQMIADLRSSLKAK